jgi:hypothetical protein
MIADLIAGVLVPEDRSFRFVAVDRRFGMLDGSRFGHAEAVRQSAARLAKAVAEHGTADPQHRLVLSRATTPCRILHA